MLSDRFVSCVCHHAQDYSEWNMSLLLIALSLPAQHRYDPPAEQLLKQSSLRWLLGHLHLRELRLRISIAAEYHLHHRPAKHRRRNCLETLHAMTIERHRNQKRCRAYGSAVTIDRYEEAKGGHGDDSGSYSGKAKGFSKKPRARWDYRCPPGSGSWLSRRNATKVPAANDRLEQTGAPTRSRVLGGDPDEPSKKREKQTMGRRPGQAG